MGTIAAYLRASTDKQDLRHQKLEILEFARKRGLRVGEFVEVTVSSQETNRQRRIDELVPMLGVTGTLIVTELSRLGGSTAEVISMVNALAKRNIRVITINQNIDIFQQDMNSKIVLTLFSLFAELERNLIGMRTNEAPAAKGRRRANSLGSPRGARIKELLGMAYRCARSPRCWAKPATSL